MIKLQCLWFCDVQGEALPFVRRWMGSAPADLQDLETGISGSGWMEKQCMEC